MAFMYANWRTGDGLKELYYKIRLFKGNVLSERSNWSAIAKLKILE